MCFLAYRTFPGTVTEAELEAMAELALGIMKELLDVAMMERRSHFVMRCHGLIGSHCHSPGGVFAHEMSLMVTEAFAWDNPNECKGTAITLFKKEDGSFDCTIHFEKPGVGTACICDINEVHTLENAGYRRRAAAFMTHLMAVGPDMLEYIDQGTNMTLQMN